MTRANRTDPHYRRRAAAGEAKGAAEARRKYHTNPENKKRATLLARQRRNALPEAAKELERTSTLLRMRRSRQRKNSARQRGIHLYTSWLRGYQTEMLRFNKLSAPKIEATIVAFEREGYHVIRNALQESDLEDVRSDARETGERASESKGWANMFSEVDSRGRLKTSSDRQMTMMDCNGPAAAICQKLVSEHLGSGGAYEMKIRAMTLLDTEAANDQPDHTDYGVDNAARWGIGFPVGGIVCFEEGSNFSTVVGSLDDRTFGERVEIDLQPGDVVLFHGAKVHRGARYMIRNRRLHFYAACRRLKVPENKTYPVEVPGVR